jgi:NitT/TauT family transport system substrate-binding protein
MNGTQPAPTGGGLTAFGKAISLLLILGLIGGGAYFFLAKKDAPKPPTPPVGPGPGPGPKPDNTAKPAVVCETKFEVPRLDAPAAYQIKNNTIELEISEYAGYSGLIVANGGMEPSENSVFFKKHGVKVKLSLSEDESWGELNNGKIAASATTVDVLAVYGKQFHVVVPAQIGFSRGADGVVVTSDIRKINQLKGKLLTAGQFTESDFFIRYLAQEAGLGVHMVRDVTEKPEPDKLNLCFCEDAFTCGDLFKSELAAGRTRLSGCVTWDPKTTEVVDESDGKAHLLTTNRNLLIVADVLVVNKSFAQQNPDKVAALVGGLLEGNRMVRDNPEPHLDTIGKAFKWDRAQTRAELAKVHLSNLPENLAFFSGSIDSAGSFGGIYNSAVLAYGNDLIKDPVDGDRFLDLQHLKALEQSGAFKEQKVSIAPIRSGAGGPVEGNPLLSKDIRFLFEANSDKLDMSNKDNLKNLEAIKQLLQVSPGSTVLLRGHVDNAMVEEFRRKGGEELVRKMALKAIELSKNRAAEIKRHLLERHGVDPKRLETVGRGWEEPTSTESEQNRRVEVQWFTLE